jgi:hypothetical protein
MRRRDFLGAVGSAVAVFPLEAFAQQAAVPTIGFLSPTSADGSVLNLEGFRKGLGEAGFVEARTSPSNTGLRTIISTACRHLQPSWWPVGSR